MRFVAVLLRDEAGSIAPRLTAGSGEEVEDLRGTISGSRLPHYLSSFFLSIIHCLAYALGGPEGQSVALPLVVDKKRKGTP